MVEQKVKQYFTERFPQFSVSEECNVQFGTRTGGIADVVLHQSMGGQKGNFVAIAECKKLPLPIPQGQAKAQLKSYMSATSTKYGVLAVGTDPRNWVFCENKYDNWFVEINQNAFETGIDNWSPLDVSLSRAQKTTRWWKRIALALGFLFILTSSLFSLLLFHLSENSPSEVPYLLSEMATIYAGEFQMGSNDTEADHDEQPVHTVYLDTFYMDVHEVTNAQYKQFVDANPEWQKERIPSTYHDGNYLKYWEGNDYPQGQENHPVVHVSWYAAMAYADWVGKRLPTEAEWEKAARGGLISQAYPWGNFIDPDKANYSGEIGGTTPVRNYPANAYGLYDMVGNVWEWCLDVYKEDFYSVSSRRNPIAGESVTELTEKYLTVKDSRVVRSGYWYNRSVYVRVADRYKLSPDSTHRGGGFRCVMSRMR